MKKISELEELIPNYGSNNELKNKYTKLATEQSKQIKEIMAKHKTTSYTVGAWTATVTDKKSQSMNEEALLEYFKRTLSKEQLKELKLIKRKEYIDENALEDAIYKGKLSEDIVTGMESCQITKITPTLNMKKG